MSAKCCVRVFFEGFQVVKIVPTHTKPPYPIDLGANLFLVDMNQVDHA